MNQDDQNELKNDLKDTLWTIVYVLIPPLAAFIGIVLYHFLTGAK